MIRIVENTEEAKEQLLFTFWAGENIVLTKDQVDALLSGKCLAWDDGEYVNMLSIEKEGD